jgi:hypothetical protein
VEEEHLFAIRRDLLTRLDLVFIDNHSLYFEGAGGHAGRDAQGRSQKSEATLQPTPSELAQSQDRLQVRLPDLDRYVGGIRLLANESIR